MKLQFSIRDLLWLTLAAAIACGWWIDHRRLSPEWSELGGPGAIEGFSTSISCCFSSDEDSSSDSESACDPTIDPAD